MVSFFFIKRKYMRPRQGGDPEKDVPLVPLASGKFKRKSSYILSLVKNHYVIF
jgi:hypothetical protein